MKIKFGFETEYEQLYIELFYFGINDYIFVYTHQNQKRVTLDKLNVHKNTKNLIKEFINDDINNILNIPVGFENSYHNAYFVCINKEE